jgi:hypothetical protein
MLLASWHNMHAQRGSELGNGTADEHSRTLIRACMDRTSQSRWTAAKPSLTGDQLVVPPGNRAGQFFPSVFISVHSRFPIQGQPLPESPPSSTRAASSTRHPFVTGSRDELTANRRRTARVRLGLTKKCRTEKYFCPTFFCQQGTWSAARIQLMVRKPTRSLHAARILAQHARPAGK